MLTRNDFQGYNGSIGPITIDYFPAIGFLAIDIFGYNIIRYVWLLKDKTDAKT